MFIMTCMHACVVSECVCVRVCVRVCVCVCVCVHKRRQTDIDIEDYKTGWERGRQRHREKGEVGGGRDRQRDTERRQNSGGEGGGGTQRAT